MGTIKVMSIIGIIWFVFCFCCATAFMATDPGAAEGWGMFAMFYGIAYSIVCLVISLKKNYPV